MRLEAEASPLEKDDQLAAGARFAEAFVGRLDRELQCVLDEPLLAQLALRYRMRKGRRSKCSLRTLTSN